MKKRNLFPCFQLFLCAVFLLCHSYKAKSQCQQFSAVLVNQSGSCDDNGTPNDPSDDTFTWDVFIDNDASLNSTWSSDDGSYSGQNYPPNFFPFGPFPISGGDVTIKITDDLFGCSEGVTLPAPPPCSDGQSQSCPVFDLCYTLQSSNSCCATYSVSMEGDLENFSNIGPINFDFVPSSQVAVSFADPSGYMASNGVVINGNNVNGGIALNGTDLENDAVIVTICGEPNETLDLNDQIVRLFVNGMICEATTTLCEDPAPFQTGSGTTISGNVTAPAYIYDCPDTQNHGIEGVEVSITNANGQVCETKTNNDGTYDCTLCDDGPFEICINTTCDEPCGVTSFDLLRLRQYIIGILKVTPEIAIIGDVDGSGYPTTRDLVLIQRHILGTDQSVIQNWCKFVPVDAFGQLPSPSPATAGDYQAIDSCTTFSDPTLDSPDFIRFMLGDLDGSCNDCIHGDDMGDLRMMAYHDEKSGSSFELSASDKIYGLSMQLTIPTGVHINAIESPLPDLSYRIDENELTIIWLDVSTNNVGYDLSANTSLVNILHDGSEALTMTGSENYVLGENLGMNRLLSEEGSLKRSANTHPLQIANLANFHIAGTEKTLNVEIYDLLGRPILSTVVRAEGSFVDLNQQLPTGVYILRVSNAQNDLSKKIFIR
ncbi:MAG: T9SS type A sorting domain-containing protein [Bacteroidota bacterium]